VRDAGDPDGWALVYMHATPGSRLDMSFCDELAAAKGVRIVSFDRPGYGRSTPARFGLETVAHDAASVADELGIDSFAVLGQSGGGPFALAAAAVLADRVTAVGVASGPGPFDRVPDALQQLDDNDRAALAQLPEDPIGSQRGFAAGFEPLVAAFRDAAPAEIVAMFQDHFSRRDSELMQREQLVTAVGESMKEALRQGPDGGGWDNVAWVGPWEIDLTAVTCPVHLWYGDEDLFAPVPHGQWLRDNLARSQYVLRRGEGHLGYIDHRAEMLADLAMDR